MKNFKNFGLTIIFLLVSFSAGAEVYSGTLIVRGEAGPSQIFRQVKVARCEPGGRSCSNVEYFDLNIPKVLAAGKYIVGFENSIYPGWVTVGPQQTTTLDLVKLTVPSALNKELKVRVFRDFDSQIERKKLFFIQYYMSRPLFRLSEYGFGDLYLTSAGMADVTLRMNYDSCNTLNLKSPDIEDAVDICLAAAQATGWRDMSVLFQFNGKDHMMRDLLKGQYVQNLVSEAGDRRQILVRRQLVSPPIHGSDFVSVFPGQYRFMSDAPSASSQSVTAGPMFEKFD